VVFFDMSHTERGKGVNLTTHNSLRQQLDNTKEKFLNQIPAGVKKKLLENIQEMKSPNLVDGAVNQGDTAPDFTLPDARGGKFNLGDALAKGPLVLSFYRGEWCPYCTLEHREMEKIYPEIKAMGASIAAISPQTIDHTLSTSKNWKISFDMLSDKGNIVAREYGLVFTVDEAIREVYKDFGINIPERNGDVSYKLPVPATYIIDKSGVVRSAFVDVDYTRRMEPEDILTQLKKIVRTPSGRASP